MSDSSVTPSFKAGTAGGTLTVLLFNIFASSDFVHTIVLSATGATVSFLVSYLLRALIRKKHKHRSPSDQ